MATYRQLLFSTGGGVMSEKNKDPQNDCATIAIGLGGTGVACLANLKKQIFQRLQSDDEKNFVPSYQHIKFLAVDTDPNALGVETDFTALDRTEFFDIHSDDINALLKNVKIMRGTPYFNWLRDDLNVLFAGAGAGGVRQCGRLLLMDSSDVFKSKIQQIINSAKAGLPAGSPVNIHIFTGMGGGTGSGTFLDACYIVRKAIQELGIHNALIFGYFVLPDVNLSVPTVAANVVVSNYIKSNGYAAMKELDYCMNFEKNGGVWDQEYKGFHIGPTKEKPVDICHLVSANTLSGVALENGFEYAMNVISDFVMQFVVKNDITMTSHISNYGMAMGGVKKQHGANYGYCVLGAANATVPYREISTYLVSRLFKDMSIMKQKAPTDADVAAFAELHGLTFRKLFQSIKKGVYQIPMIDLGNDAWKDYRDNMPETDKMDPTQLRLPPDIESNYNRFLANNLNIYSSNEQALMAAWSNRSDAPGMATSKVCETMNALIEVILDPEKGPYYATTLLGGAERTNLLTLLFGALKETQATQQNMQSEAMNRIQAVKARRSAFVNAGAFAHKRKLFEETLSAITAYYDVLTQIEALNHLQTVINSVIEQLTALKQTYFDVYIRIMNDLIDTFDENYRVLVDLTDAVEDPFIVPLMKIADLRPSLDKTVMNMKLPNEMTLFHQNFFKNYDIWLNREERKICPFVSQYLIGRFADSTNKTLNDYLEIRFKTNDPATLASLSYKELLRPLAEKADPLFWLAGGNFSAASAGALGYCSVPDTSAVLMSSVKNLTSASPELREIHSKQSDRIFLLRCTVGVPIYAYNGIPVYYNNYLAAKDKGMHYYEGCGSTSGNASDPRNWRMLYDMMPYSANNNTTPAIEERAKIYGKAVADGIIKTIGRDYYVAVTPDIKAKIAETENAINAAQDVDALKTIQNTFEAFAAAIPEEKRISIENDGTTGFEVAVRKDHALASDVIMDAIKDEMQKAEQITAIRAKLAKAVDDMMSKLTVRDDFFNALFTGVFKFQLPKVLYQFEEYGIPDEMTLSDPTMPKGRMPLYQAFLSFQAMEEYQREAVKNASDDRLSVIDPALKEACTLLKQVVTPQYLNVMKSHAVKFPDEKNSILEFFGAFNQALEDFIISYAL